MVKDIIKYPTPLSVEYAVDVRLFNEELWQLIEDLKDTINANNLEALSAFQIGCFYNVIVLKESDGNFLELINARLISQSGRITTSETTSYYGDISAEIERYEKISIVYQDREGNDKSLQAEGDLAIVLQRKIDYTFGATFIHKMSTSQKEKFEAELKGEDKNAHSNYNPRSYLKDKIITVINFLLIVLFALSLYVLFGENQIEKVQLWSYELYVAYGVIFLMFLSLFFTYYESKRYKLCINGQMSNSLLVFSVIMLKLALILGVSYYFIRPS